VNSVIKGSSYILVHTPDMVLHNGTTQTTEMVVNPDSEYLKEVPKNLRKFEDVVGYAANQAYIGNINNEDLGKIELPWYEKVDKSADRFGKFGEIMPQEEFLLLVDACDMFEVVKLDKGFVAKYKDAFASNPIISEDIVAMVSEGAEMSEIENIVNNEHGEGLYQGDVLIGAVKRAHDIDVNLNAHVMHENLMSKASSVLALLYAVRNAGIAKEDVDYVIDCSEEACGDMNQRGGGNFAKAAAETAGFVNATGSDTRGFCAAPVHALVKAAALVKSGAYKTVIVTSGGSTAKLGMNGKDHLKKEMPILEDCLGGLAIVVTENDGVSPEINLEMIGRHTIGTGSSPQAVTAALVTASLDRMGMKVADIDKYSPEMQNPDITVPAGAGNVPLSNFKMIGALAAKRGEMTPKDLPAFIEKHGLTGYAPTQGHIPSGVPYIGPGCEDIKAGKIKNAMIIGKGSLFLGRMTNQFDGVSFVIQANTGATSSSGVSEEEVKGLIAKAMKEFAQSLVTE